MANNNIGKKTGPDAVLKSATEAISTSKPKTDNIFARHGNQQITQAIQTAQAEQTQSESLLASLSSDTEQGAEAAQSWWQEDEQIAQKKSVEDEQVVDAQKKMKKAGGSDPDRARLTGSEKEGLLEIKKAQMKEGTVLAEEAALLTLAESQGMAEDEKAELLLENGDIDVENLKDESGELRTLVAADMLPGQLHKFDQVAAPDAADSPLSERETLRNVTETMKQIAMQIEKYPSLVDDTLSVEQKTTDLVDILSGELDLPTLESVSAHSFKALTEELIFQPEAINSVNRLAGSKRNVRVLGSFGVIFWQIANDAVRDQLEQSGKEQIHEGEFLAQTYREMATKMYIDAMAKPTSV